MVILFSGILLKLLPPDVIFCSYSAPPDPLAGFKGPTSKGRGGEGPGGDGREGVEGAGEGRGRGGKGPPGFGLHPPEIES